MSQNIRLQDFEHSAYIVQEDPQHMANELNWWLRVLTGILKCLPDPSTKRL